VKYKRFEELPVWKDAAKLAAEMFRFSALPAFRGKGDLANPLQRATLSISNNIAEGFERGTTKELITFLYYARGSAGEVRSMLAMMRMMPDFESLDAQIGRDKETVESITRQIRGWAQSLQDSDTTGQRYLTKQSQEEETRRKSREAFLEKVEALTKKSRGF
jgi:four helix bundle protein